MMTSNEIRLADFIYEDCILCNVGAVARDALLKQLVDALHRRYGGFDSADALEGVLERERQSPTVLGEGIALPHARLSGLSGPCLAMATSHEGIDFETPTADPVHVAVMILTPKDDPGAYLRLMASLSKRLADQHVIKRLVSGGSAREALGILVGGSDRVEIKLNADSIMTRNPITLEEGDTLATAIQAFCSNRVMDIPIVDDEGDLRGVIAVEDLLGQSLPQHLLWMEDLSPIENFEPFAELLRKDTETKVADFMHDKFVAIPPDMPAIQLAKIFLMQKIRQIQVVDGRRFLGTIDLNSFSSQIFWA